ncbi:MAG TPA: MotA/TolQ/ExbB proton channel family protein [Chitinophagaceae bacterium]|nr:MotA/TolQ/ExbB proton channel family protein [Chitinophagaceae bacterium]HNU16051.1 MotA/TolQ/ExbB proton channel family protein [Chitinophagaceae bacterium]
MIDLLQMTDTLTNVAKKVAGDSNNDGYLSFWELLTTGGWIMLPLAVMLLGVVYVFAERSIAIRNAGKIDNNFMNIIRDNIVSGNVTAARNFAKNTNNPVARIIDKGIQRIGKPIDSIEKSMDNVGVLEMYKLEKNLGVLSVISKAAPIFGFVGTLVGLMQMFSGITTSNEFEVSTIAGGIYTKLITSITGLVIGLIAYLGYSYLNTQIDKTSNKMEAASADFLDILQEPTR